MRQSVLPGPYFAQVALRCHRGHAPSLKVAPRIRSHPLQREASATFENMAGGKFNNGLKERVFLVTVGEMLLKLRYVSQDFPAVESHEQSKKHRD